MVRFSNHVVGSRNTVTRKIECSAVECLNYFFNPRCAEPVAHHIPGTFEQQAAGMPIRLAEDNPVFRLWRVV